MAKTALKGCQTPRISYEPKRQYSDVEDAVQLAAACRMTPDPWQNDVLDAWLGRDKHDKFTSTTCGLSVPRQNGKNAIIEFRELYGLVVLGEKILHSAHEVKTANEAFRRLALYFDNPEEFPEMAEMALRIRRTNGQEAIELSNGGLIRFSARSKGAARGMSFDCVVFDEAQFMREEELEAMMSTMAAAPLRNRQVIYTGTPPSNDTQGEVFGRIRKSAINKTDKHLCWHEWSVAEIGDIMDKTRWYQCNPALGYRLDETFTQAEAMSLSEEGFARERLGWWEASGGSSMFGEAAWNDLATDAPPEDGKLAYGVKFDTAGEMCSLVVALKPKGGHPHVELVHQRSIRAEGLNWLADWILARKDKVAVVVVDGKSAADTLFQKLRDGKMPPKALRSAGTSGIIAASSMFRNAVKEGELTHFAQPALDSAIMNAKRRPVGSDGGFGFTGINGYDVTPVEAAALAYWGVMTTKRNPGRKSRLL